MLSFGTFLIEATQNEDKLKHLEHAEDWPINAGEEGFKGMKLKGQAYLPSMMVLLQSFLVIIQKQESSL